MWMSLAEALICAGSLEALRPRLLAGGILSRHKGLYTLPDGRAVRGPGDIPPGLWATALEDPATGRLVFATIRYFIDWDDNLSAPYRVIAVGVELESEQVERFFPAAPESEPMSSFVKPSVARKHAGGSDPQHDWDAAARYVDEWVAIHGPLQRRKNGEPIIAAAIEVMTEWFEKVKKVPVPQRNTFYRWFETHPAPERWFVT